MILYAGSYTEIVAGNFGGHGEGIYCFDFNTGTGSLQLKHVQPALSPSYLCIPSAKYLYTSTEVIASKRPYVQAYKINSSDFSLQLISEQEIPGGCPCHINYSKNNNCIVVACYETGNVILYPLEAGGKLLPYSKQLLHEGSSIDKLRQEKAHAHAVAIDETTGNMLVADLGIDKVIMYHLGTVHGALATTFKQAVSLPPGSGPRHIVFQPQANNAFVLNELSGTVTRMIYSNGGLGQGRTYNILPKGFKVAPSAAAIRVSADGKFIYTSERGDNSIAVLQFNTETETLEIIQRRETTGKTPRDFIIDPTGNWLLAAHQDSDSIAIFKVDKNSGMIEPVNLVENITSPASLAWLPL